MRTARSMNTIRCAIYTRKSSEEGLQQEFNSLDAQRESGESYIQSQAHEGWTLVDDHYDDGGFTGGNMERPALGRLIADIQAGQIDCVVVYKVDRLSRSLLDFAKMMETFERHRVAFVSVTQQFNTSTSMGRLMLNVLFSFAQFEREVISERTRDKIAAARRKGKWSGGMPVLGYDVDPRTHKLIVNEAEAQQVRATFELYLQQETLLSTAEELARRGWVNKRWTTRKGNTRGGQPFGKGRLHKLLTNVVYLGKIRYKSEIHQGEQEALVSSEVWERVQTLLKQNSRGEGTRLGLRFDALLKGLFRCGPCGCALSPAHTTKNHTCYRYYVCVHAQQRGWKSCPTKSVAAEPVERFVIEQLRALVRGSQTATRLRHDDQKRLAEVSRACQDAQEESRRCEREVSRLRTQVEAGLQLAAKKRALLDRQLEMAQREAARAQERLVAMEAAQLERQEAVGCWRLFDSDWDKLDAAIQASVLGRWIEYVEYDRPANALAIRLHSGPLASVAREAADGGRVQMAQERTIRYPFRFQSGSFRHKKLRIGTREVAATAGRLPRISRLMALAIRFDQLRRSGEVADYATLAELGKVSRARITQIMNLLHLAPDIQEALLFLPSVGLGRDPIHVRQLQPIAALMSWRRQRSRWRALRSTACQP